MEFLWEKHLDLATNYPLWCQQLQDKQSSGKVLSVDELLLLAKIAHDAAKGNLDLFDQAIADLERMALTEDYQQSYLYYLKALQERSFNRLPEACEWAKRSAQESQDHPFQPIAQSLYALYLSESKKVHYGLEIFQEILELETIPYLAQQAAVSNLITFSIELGITSALDEYYHQANVAQQLRIDLYRAILKDDLHYILALIKRCPIDYSFYKLALVTTDLISYASLCSIEGDNRIIQKLKNSWVVDYLRPLKNDPLFKRLSNLIEEQGEIADDEALPSSWYAQLRIYYLSFLIELKKGDTEKAKALLQNKISPLAEELRINNPLVPHLSYGRLIPDSIVSQKLTKLLGNTKVNSAAEIVKVGCRTVSYCKGATQVDVDFSKSLKSLTLLRVIAGDQGRSCNKELIHNALSDDPYHPLEHDSRIHKLLDRLQKKLCDEGFPELWYKPGDNNIVLNLPIEII